MAAGRDISEYYVMRLIQRARQNLILGRPLPVLASRDHSSDQAVSNPDKTGIQMSSEEYPDLQTNTKIDHKADDISGKSGLANPPKTDDSIVNNRRQTIPAKPVQSVQPDFPKTNRTTSHQDGTDAFKQQPPSSITKTEKPNKPNAQPLITPNTSVTHFETPSADASAAPTANAKASFPLEKPVQNSEILKTATDRQKSSAVKVSTPVKSLPVRKTPVRPVIDSRPAQMMAAANAHPQHRTSARKAHPAKKSLQNSLHIGQINLVVKPDRPAPLLPSAKTAKIRQSAELPSPKPKTNPRYRKRF